MGDRDVRLELQEPDCGKRPYESPEAVVVPIKLEERALGCNFTTIQVCGLTEL